VRAAIQGCVATATPNPTKETIMNSLRRHSLLLACITLLGLACAAPALAADEVNVSAGLTAAGAPLALHGHDPVAYFTASAPTAGKAELALVHDGASYYFASEANRDAFQKNPSRYAPAFGGFCAYGVSVGKKFDGDPRFWKISGGRLYLNLNAEIARAFEKDVAGNVAKAEQQWQTIEHAPVADL
jgi:YHS domain-containing protein